MAREPFRPHYDWPSVSLNRMDAEDKLVWERIMNPPSVWRPIRRLKWRRLERSRRFYFERYPMNERSDGGA